MRRKGTGVPYRTQIPPKPMAIKALCPLPGCSCHPPVVGSPGKEAMIWGWKMGKRTVKLPPQGFSSHLKTSGGTIEIMKQ